MKSYVTFMLPFNLTNIPLHLSHHALQLKSFTKNLSFNFASVYNFNIQKTTNLFLRDKRRLTLFLLIITLTGSLLPCPPT